MLIYIYINIHARMHAGMHTCWNISHSILVSYYKPWSLISCYAQILQPFWTALSTFFCHCSRSWHLSVSSVVFGEKVRPRSVAGSLQVFANAMGEAPQGHLPFCYLKWMPCPSSVSWCIFQRKVCISTHPCLAKDLGMYWSMFFFL